jgi:hypothetical protein
MKKPANLGRFGGFQASAPVTHWGMSAAVKGRVDTAGERL